MILRVGNGLSSEVPVRFVVVELDAIGSAELSQDLHDVILLFGRELVLRDEGGDENGKILLFKGLGAIRWER